MWTVARSHEGFLLIEVLISALMLGMIAIATVTGLEAVDNGDANQRLHNEAVLLAAQSQEELRSDPVSALETLLTNPHTFTKTADGSSYTITQEVHELSTKDEQTSCTVVEHGNYTAPNFRISSTVKWNFLKAGHPVTESSIITPPTSSSLEVDVGNAASPPAGVAGVTVLVSYSAFETGTPLKLEGVTSSQGCVFFTGIRATSATVSIPEKANFVTPSGTLKVPSSEVSIAPSITTRDQVTYDEGGAIAANFTYNGKSTYEGKTVTGDTFVVSNAEMGLAPELELGSAGVFTYEIGGEERYTAKTSSYAVSGVTAKGAHYAHGDLFPLPSSWTVFAGDCAANNPSTVSKGVVSPGEGVVTPGNTVGIIAPMSYVDAEVYSGTEKSPKALNSEAFPVKITNLSCSAASPAPTTPDNAVAVSYTHTQRLTGGALEDPFQPFGKLELCVQAFESATKPSEDRIDKIAYEDTAVEGPRFKLYPQELTQASEQKAREEREAKEPAREKRVAEEAEQAKERTEEASKTATRTTEEQALKTAAAAEASAKAARLTEEANNIKKWEAEEKAKFGKKITKAEREKLEKEQEKKAKEDAAAETTAQAKRATEEKALLTQAETEAEAKKARGERESKTGEVKTKEEATAKQLTKEEEERAKAKEKEATEGKAQKVESGSGVKC